jgi:WD40 repeat protein
MNAVAHFYSISQMSWDRSGKFLATASLDSTVKVWRVNSESSRYVIQNSTRHRNNNENDKSDKMEVEGVPLHQLQQIDVTEFLEVESDGIYGALLSPNALLITALIRFYSTLH